MNFDFAEMERRLSTLEANRGASLRFGTVTGVDAGKGAASVQLPDGEGMISHPLRVLQKRTLKDKNQCFPDVEEQVACLFSGQGLEQGVVLGAVYSSKDASPNNSSQVDSTNYADGAFVAYDRETHKYIVTLPDEGSILFSIGDSSFEMTRKGITMKATRIDMN